jgi:hypothetical protein
MMNSKLQAALDELERLRDTVKGYRDRNAKLPNPDSDAGRAVTLINDFNSALEKLHLGAAIKP